MERLEAIGGMMRMGAPGEGDRGGADGTEPAGEPAERLIDSHVLFGPARKVIIRHGREHYTLRVTRAGKLILTK